MGEEFDWGESGAAMSGDVATQLAGFGAGALAGSDCAAPEMAERAHAERREERVPTNWIALIRLLDGSEIPCNVKDVSVSGAKLGVPESVALPEIFMLKIVGRDFVCLVRLAWRRGNLAGVHIGRVGKLPRPSSLLNLLGRRATRTAATKPSRPGAVDSLRSERRAPPLHDLVRARPDARA